MTTMLAKFVSKKILGERLENKFGREDPYFEQVPATRLDGRPSGKFKKQRKALPPGISEHDGQVLTKVKRRAYRLDMSLFNLCGIRFGWSSVIGIIPAIGDVIDAFMAFMVVHTCQQIEGGLPQTVKSRMYFNIMLDFGVGLVPFLGDVADALFRANTRNATILEEYLREKGKKNLRQSGMPIPAIDPSDPAEFDRLHKDDPPRYNSKSPPAQATASSQPHGSGGSGNGHSNVINTATPTKPAVATTKESGRSSRGFFNFGSKSRPDDVEMGQGHSSKATIQKQQPRS